MRVIVIQEEEGYEGQLYDVIEVPKGKKPEQVYQQWCAEEFLKNGECYEVPSDVKESSRYTVMKVGRTFYGSPCFVTIHA